jgi:hypothetical protein
MLLRYKLYSRRPSAISTKEFDSAHNAIEDDASFSEMRHHGERSFQICEKVAFLGSKPETNLLGESLLGGLYTSDGEARASAFIEAMRCVDREFQ